MTGSEWSVRAQWATGDVVTCDVDGAAVSFESPDVPLTMSPEAAALAFLVPAVEQHAHMVVEPAVSDRWHERSARAVGVLSDWFGYLPEHPVRASSGAESTPDPGRTGGTGVFFTGGVDSWWTILTEVPNPTHLVYVRGFDMWLEQEDKFRSFEPTLREAAAALGAAPVVVTTDLRRHHRHLSSNWGRGHGAALAAVATMLEGTLDEALISASESSGRARPWGSSPRLDYLLTDPHRVRLVHGNATLGRVDKLADIATEPLVQRGLRVCARDEHPSGNCSTCEKCVRTMTCLDHIGLLGAFDSVFDLSASLVDRIDGVPRVRGDTRAVWTALYRQVAPRRDLRRAIARLLSRTVISGVRTRARASLQRSTER